MSEQSISVVIPVYNSEKTIRILVDQLISALSDQYKLQIVIVNDESQDNSHAVCVELHAACPNSIEYIRLAKNSGQHSAIMAGLNQAHGDYVVLMDDDLQHGVHNIHNMIQYTKQHDYDVLFTRFKEKKHSVFRRIGSKWNDWVADLMLKKPKGLYLSSFKVLNRFLVDTITQYDGPFTYIDGLILRSTNEIGQIEIAHHDRYAGESTYTLKKLISLWLDVVTGFSVLPLRLSVVVGFGISGISFVYGIYVVYMKITMPDLPMGWPTIIVAILFFSGVQLIFLGIIGEYLGRALMILNKRPQYSIREHRPSQTKK